MKKLILAFTGTLFGLGMLAISLPAGAQGTPPGAMAQPVVTTTYVDSRCGSWQGDNWIANGTCVGPNLMRHQRVAGTIIAVKGHLVTIQQSKGTIVINDQPALNRETSGKVAVGRSIIAHGYWRDDVFYATLLN